MRIAIFAEYYYPFVSGVVTHVETLRNGLEAAGHEVLIVTLDPAAKNHYIKDHVLYCPAVPVKKIYGYGVASPVNALRMRILKRFNPDILHIHTEFTMGLFALYAARQLKKPVVYTLHTLYDDYVFYIVPKRMEGVAKPFAHAYIRKIASYATEVIGPSSKVVEYLRLCGVDRHVNIVPNTVDLSAFAAENVGEDAVQAARDRLGIQKNDTALCFVGRLGKEKSLDVLIDCFARAFAGERNYKLFLIGEGPEKQALEEQIATLGVQGQVQLTGRIEHDELPAYYHACHLFATASLSEMNSISMLEATASGLYILQRLDIYNRDLIKSGINGDVFESVTEFEKLVRNQDALPPDAKQRRRQIAAAFSRRYGEREFTAAVLNVYARAVHRYRPK
ncbi:glycosyltransferase [Ruminococcaceae bacterium OttesenSCG-928-O06]|nr:glycosyltransferase [Ruminococcaceae bacterium OttesenSCG-928-O06]